MEMSDLLATLGSVAEDPLVIAVILLVLGVITTRFLFRGYPVRGSVARGVFFVLITIALIRGQIIPYQPIHPAGSSFRNVVQVGLEVAWWLYGAWLLVTILRHVLVFE